jgi:hypothetical protein
VGTVLSLWDAAELDAAGQDGEVLPKFINLTDASIKMVRNFLAQKSSQTNYGRLNHFLQGKTTRHHYKTFLASQLLAKIATFCTSIHITR